MKIKYFWNIYATISSLTFLPNITPNVREKSIRLFFIFFISASIWDNTIYQARLGLSSSNIANHPMVMKLSALTTTHHLLKRYQLVILRDMMRMKQALGTNVRPRLWESWYRNEVDLRNESPNVHNLFLWSLERLENEENADMLPVTRFSPWRPAE